jgi:hypothetical protein
MLVHRQLPTCFSCTRKARMQLHSSHAIVSQSVQPHQDLVRRCSARKLAICSFIATFVWFVARIGCLAPGYTLRPSRGSSGNKKGANPSSSCAGSHYANRRLLLPPIARRQWLRIASKIGLHVFKQGSDKAAGSKRLPAVKPGPAWPAA